MPPTGIEWSSLPWQDIVPRVVLFAHSLLRRKPFAGVESGPEDLAWGAIEKTISGTRQWDVKNVGLVEHLMGVVSSDLYNSIRKHAAFPMESLYEIAADQIASEDRTPEELTTSKSEVLNLLNFLRDKDERLAELAALSASFGTYRPGELAQLMNLSVREIYALKKKLRRATEQWQTQQANFG